MSLNKSYTLKCSANALQSVTCSFGVPGSLVSKEQEGKNWYVS